jgi:hypothetical protein
VFTGGPDTAHRLLTGPADRGAGPGPGVKEQYRPVRPARARWAIAARIARVTLSRARSACEAARRSRPPSPTARASSPLGRRCR